VASLCLLALSRLSLVQPPVTLRTPSCEATTLDSTPGVASFCRVHCRRLKGSLHHKAQTKIIGRTTAIKGISQTLRSVLWYRALGARSVAFSVQYRTTTVDVSALALCLKGKARLPDESVSSGPQRLYLFRRITSALSLSPARNCHTSYHKTVNGLPITSSLFA